MIPFRSLQLKVGITDKEKEKKLKKVEVSTVGNINANGELSVGLGPMSVLCPQLILGGFSAGIGCL
jgi:hypothetical protein